MLWMQYISFVFSHIFVFRNLKVVNIETGQKFWNCTMCGFWSLTLSLPLWTVLLKKSVYLDLKESSWLKVRTFFGPVYGRDYRFSSAYPLTVVGCICVETLVPDISYTLILDSLLSSWSHRGRRSLNASSAEQHDSKSMPWPNKWL